MTAIAEPAATPVNDPAAAPAPNITAAADRAAVNTEIRSIARIAGLDQTWTDARIDEGATVEAARGAAFDAMRTRSAPVANVRTTTIEVGTDYSDPTLRARAIGEALFLRVDPTHKPSNEARAYVGLTIPEVAKDCLRARGIATTGMSTATVIERALHTTSDFALALGNTVGRTLRASYQTTPSGIRQVARQTTAPDFRKRSRIMVDHSGLSLEKVNEHGEFKSGTLVEAAEAYKLDTFGRIIGITRQALVNDDLGAFTDLTRRLGQASASFEAQALVNLLESGSGNGPTMSDNKALFHVDHKNKGAENVLEIALSAARLAMRKQTGPGGGRIGVAPKFVVVPPDLETIAEKALSIVQAAKTDDVNPFASLTLVVEPRLANAARFYIVADPAEIDGLEYAYLAGAPGPQTETRAGFEVDGVQVKVRLDYGAGFIDWRGWYANTGA